MGAALLWLDDFNRRCTGIDVDVAVHGVRRVGWILRLSSAERSGVDPLLNMSNGREALYFER